MTASSKSVVNVEPNVFIDCAKARSAFVSEVNSSVISDIAEVLATVSRPNKRALSKASSCKSAVDANPSKLASVGTKSATACMAAFLANISAAIALFLAVSSADILVFNSVLKEVPKLVTDCAIA